ncbi:MAG: pentapeptide repeat-containing protein [Leptolyngbyaceae cyanobacterium]
MGITIDGDLEESKASSVMELVIMECLPLLREAAHSNLVEISSIITKPIQLNLQGKDKVLRHLKDLIDSEELTQLGEHKIESSRLFFDLRNVDLSCAYFYGVNFSYANLNGANLRGVRFCNCSLDHVNLGEANLVGAWLCGANLKDANLRGAKLNSADLAVTDMRNADLRYARLINSTLVRADLRKANLLGADLSYSDPSQARFIDAVLMHARFVKAGLWNANLSYADIRFADFSGATLREANLIGTKMGEELKVERAEFGNNPGLTEEDQRQLQRRGAYCRDLPESSGIVAYISYDS